jgi:hypothetical protein
MIKWERRSRVDTGILFTVELATYKDSGVLDSKFNFNVFVDASDCLEVSSDEEEIDIGQMEEMAVKYAMDKFFDQGNVLRVGEMIEVADVRY